MYDGDVDNMLTRRKINDWLSKLHSVYKKPKINYIEI